MTEPIWKRDAYEIADSIRAGDVSSKEVVETFLERIDAHNEELNAFVHLDHERARNEAAEIDRSIAAGGDPGPLAGVPIGIKDLENVEGMPTRLGSVPYKDVVADHDNVQTARLRAAGAVVVGKTATPEFGSTAFTRTFLHGTTRNPWNLERTPGGSSGGSAAAVAAAIIPIASASDGGGSIRIPASYTGLFGAKGTYGRIPKVDGPESSFTSVLGCVSRCVRDTARYWDVVVGSDERDAYSLPHPGLSYEAVLNETPSGLRAAWSADLGYHACRSDIAKVTETAADALVGAIGARWVDRPVELKNMSVAWGLFGYPGTWVEVRDFWPDRAEDFTPTIRAAVRDAEERFNHIELARAIQRRHENNRRLAELFTDVDILFTPTTGTTAFRAEGPMPTDVEGRKIKPMQSIFTYPFNISGHPAVSVPCGFDADGLPVALQIVARRHEDHVALQLAAAFEQTQPWTKIATAYDP
ncbi:MAG TPA: amidase [Actinomycetota bacterium]|jgi:aspartyl-tRNA(Asn)/glutamyl-tRNA(Gln) amidotransferase subunit A|nr:amidase [Actinomycetota bacterium]